MTSELTKTSLLVIASVFTATGSAIILTNIVAGSVMLLVGVGILVLRGWLKQKGIDVRNNG